MLSLINFMTCYQFIYFSLTLAESNLIQFARFSIRTKQYAKLSTVGCLNVHDQTISCKYVKPNRTEDFLLLLIQETQMLKTGL